MNQLPDFPPPPPLTGFDGLVSATPSAPPADPYTHVIQKYEVHPKFQEHIGLFTDCVVAVIADDSGSMRKVDRRSGVSRWNELKETVGLLADFYSVTHPEGLSIHFLNRPPVTGLTSASQVYTAFANPPIGMTPLTRALDNVLQHYQHVVDSGRKLVIYIATDGEPTTDTGDSDIHGFERKLSQALSHPLRYCTISACTDNDQDVEYMNGWDKKYPRCDVVDDYHSEKEEILKVQGRDFRFSNGDYIIKAVFGCMVQSLDILDETYVGDRRSSVDYTRKTYSYPYTNPPYSTDGAYIPAQVTVIDTYERTHQLQRKESKDSGCGCW